MKKPLTTTLDLASYDFLTQEAKEKKVPLNNILEKALKMYKQAKLAREVQKGLQERQQEYEDIANEFADLQNISLQDT